MLDSLFTVPGDGNVEFLPILRHLNEADYEGWLVTEAKQAPQVAHLLTYA